MLGRLALEMKEADAGLDAGLAEARRNGWEVTIAVVDAGGHLMLLSRLDNASPSSVKTAVGKARTAALTGFPSKLVEKMISDRPALLSLDRVAVEGGVP